jgi:phosphate transport system substrate-binding protein
MSTPAGASGTTPPADTIQPKKSSSGAKYVVVAIVVVILLVLVGGYALGLFTPKKTSSGACPASTSLTGAGSTFVLPLMQKWEATYTGSSVNYQGVGSGAGIQQITAKTVDFGATDAPLSGTQAKAAPGLLTFPESAGGVAIIYTIPGIAKPIQLTGSVIAQIYLGTVTTWNNSAITSLNTGVTFPNLAITPVWRSDGSGTSFVFTDFLSKDSTTFASSIGKSTQPHFTIGLGAKGSSAVAATVQSTSGSIGYVDLTYALNNGISYAKVQNPAGVYVLPTVNDIAAAIQNNSAGLPAGNGDWSNVSVVNSAGTGDYPIASLTYLLVYQSLSGSGLSYSLGKAENLVNWLNWTVHTGQTFSGQLYYVPLPASIVSVDVATLKTVTYNGAVVPECGG